MRISIIVILTACFAQQCMSFSAERKFNISLTARIPPFMQYLDMVSMDWFIKNVSALDDKQCNKDLYSVLQALSNNEVWPQLMLDASGDFESGGFHAHTTYLGDYDQCLMTRPKNVNFTTQYCILSIDPAVEILDTEQFGQPYHKTPVFLMGKCLPSSCSPAYLTKIMGELKIPNTDTLVSEQLKIWVEDGDCRKENDSIPYTTLNYVTIGILLAILSLSILGTIYDLWQKNVKHNENPDPVYLSFSLIENLKLALLIGHTQKKNDAANAWKVVVTLLVVFCHSIYVPVIASFSDSNNAFGITGYYVNHWSIIFPNFYLVVDYFLFAAGMLSIFVYFRDIQVTRKYDPILQILRRYINLGFPLFLITLMRIGISDHFDDGPAYHAINSNFFMKPCEGKILSTIFLYHNYLYSYKQCYQHSWYICVDMHLFIVSQTVVLATHYSQNVGAGLAFLLTIAAAILEFAIGYKYDLGFNANMDQGRGFDHDYYYSHTRSVPYFAGMVFAFVLLRSKKKKTKLTLIEQIFWWSVSFGCLVFTVIPFAYYDYKTYPQPFSAIYLPVHRITFCIIMGWLIYATNEGYTEQLARFFSTKFFFFIGNIAFEIYIVHFPLMEYFTASMRNTYYFSPDRALYHAFANIWLCCFFAIILGVTFTFPIRKLTSHYFKTITIFPVSKEDKIDKNIELKSN